MKYHIFVLILITGMIPYASAAQLDATILHNGDITEPSFEFLRVIYIEYPNGGQLAEILQGQSQTLSFDSDGTYGTKELVALINQNLESIPSNAITTDAKIKYQTTLQGNQNYAVIEYKLQIFPTLTNHIFRQDDQTSIVDASWRGISVSEPIIILTTHGPFDVNNPKYALDVMAPNVSEKLQEISILEMPLVDASGINDLPLNRWHSLFDNTAILPGAVAINYTGENVITHYSMGECTIFIGTCDDREWVHDIVLDKQYTVRIIESRDDATIALEGYADSGKVDKFEVFQTRLKEPQEYVLSEDEFLVTAMYGMAVIGVIGAVVMFSISNRKLKRDKNEGQTGVDPAHLVSYETSTSSGGYKTNRGESYLISDKKSKMPL
ncbi:MAG: hypothetical protein IS860_03695 [Nitrosopumilus sp.]|nr:hypothetical protein [Nitrosopumilus sp.]